MGRRARQGEHGRHQLVPVLVVWKLSVGSCVAIGTTERWLAEKCQATADVSGGARKIQHKPIENYIQNARNARSLFCPRGATPEVVECSGDGCWTRGTALGDWKMPCALAIFAADSARLL